MPSALVSWIGLTDLKASEGASEAGQGPLAQALLGKEYEYDRAEIISDHPAKVTGRYVAWLRKRTTAAIKVRSVTLSSPTAFGEIYEAAVATVAAALERVGRPASLTFHLSPGTPAMAAVWVILAKTRYPATLIESSIKHGVKVASVPFDISAEFIPDLLAAPDQQAGLLAEAAAPAAPEFADIIHQSAAMKRVLARARRVASRGLAVLIEGESGTGKELLARAMHRASPRRAGPFVAINCGAIPKDLLEAELFGARKGAYTGATQDRPGHFVSANKGTIFLDEVGELTPGAQVALLRVLQEKEVLRIGDSRPTPVDVRVFAATNRRLIEEVAAGRFRADLYYRIAVAVLGLPPLRERKGDTGLLLDRFLERVNHESAEEPGWKERKLSPGGRNALLQYPWPGNVRELMNTLTRAALWSEDPVITAADVCEALTPPAEGAPAASALGRPLGDGFSLKGLLDDVARHYLERAVTDAGGNKSQAAKLLGFANYQTLSNWLVRYGVR